jgi:hypothetical protein
VAGRHRRRAGVGDHIITRHNQRGLSTGRGRVKNGDAWRVSQRHRDGSLTVTSQTGRASATLPADYVRAHVELGYATTAHRAQGRTVDTAHAYICAATTREPLYVMATRGRHANRLYVDTSHDPDTTTAHLPPDQLDSVDVLRTVVVTPGADASATETLRHAWDERHGIARLWAEYRTLAPRAEHGRYDDLLAGSGLAPDQLQAVRDSPAHRPLLTALRQAEGAGLNVHKAFPRLVQGRFLNGADDPALIRDRARHLATAAIEQHQP